MGVKRIGSNIQLRATSEPHNLSFLKRLLDQIESKTYGGINLHLYYQAGYVTPVGISSM